MTQVRRIKPARRLTLVPLIDVLFILLVYFMVTSVYRDLDMIPVVRVGDAAPSVGMAPVGASVLLRLTADGQIAARGRVMDAAELTRLLDEARETEVRVLILPLGSAPLSALTDLLDAVAQAGVTDARLIRLEAAD